MFVIIFNLCGAVAVVETRVGASLWWRGWELVLACHRVHDDGVDDDADGSADHDHGVYGDDNNHGDDGDDDIDQRQEGDP